MKVFGTWKVSISDEEYVWEPDQWLGSTWNQIETDLKMTYQQFVQALDKKSFLPCQWLIWYLRKASGNETDRLSTDFPLMQLEIKEIVDDPEEQAADTPPSETGTSSSSSTNTESDQATGTT